MTDRNRPDRRLSRTTLYALLGGFVSIPLTVAYNRYVGAENEFSLALVVVGGLLAGYLAERAGANVTGAGFGAGVIGGLAGYAWILPALLDTASDFGAAWSFPPATFVLALLFTVVVLGFGGLVGLLGGIVGGWLADVVHRLRSSPAGA